MPLLMACSDAYKANYNNQQAYELAVWHDMLSLCSAGDCRAEDAGSELHERGSGHAHCGRHSKEHGREDSGIMSQRVAVKGHQVWGFSILALPSAAVAGLLSTAVLRPDCSHASRKHGFRACCNFLCWAQRVSQPDTLPTLT